MDHGESETPPEVRIWGKAPQGQNESIAATLVCSCPAGLAFALALASAAERDTLFVNYLSQSKQRLADFNNTEQSEAVVNQQSGPQDPLVLSYLSLRQAVGIIGCALPFVLVIGKIVLQGPGIQPSISGYYYTDMRNVFVGSLCAIGVFLMSTRGYDRKDEIAGYLACVFAIGVALFPTTPYVCATSRDEHIGTVHLSFAALLFLTLAYFSLALFTKTDPNKTPTRQKLRRNKVYRFCGWTILACIFLMFVVALPAIKAVVERCTPVFWLESVAVFVFGVSWLTKGETILKDEEA